jgi:hypothetical protein
VIDAGLIGPARAATLQHRRDAVAAFRLPSMEQMFELHDGRLEAAADMSFMFRDLENYGESLGNCWGEADGERMTLRRNGGRAAPRFPRFCHLAPRGSSEWAGAAP